MTTPDFVPGPSRAPSPTIVLGVLGGIASGKSAVARMLAGPEGEVIDADELAHRALERPEVLEEVRARFGDEVFDAEGRPDRAAIARIAFRSADHRRALEGWIHPVVRVRIRELLTAARSRGVPRVVLDVPLLLENEAEHGLASLCDELVFVDSDEAERERRVMRDRGWSPGEMARREASQLPLEEKRERAHHVIENNGDLERLKAAVLSLLERMEATRAGR
jgi:dephospho-CoA kinase